jgi:hypothetical protein
MLGRFNSFAKSVILRINEARDLGEYDRYRFYDHMKAYTAAPPRRAARGRKAPARIHDRQLLRRGDDPDAARIVRDSRNLFPILTTL